MTLTFKMSEIEATAIQTREYVKQNNDAPTLNRVGVALTNRTEFLYLLCKAIKQADKNDQNNISTESYNINTETVTQTVTAGQMQKAEYLGRCGELISFIESKHTTPGLHTTSLGKLNLRNTIYVYSRIMAYYAEKGVLPNYVEVTNSLGNVITSSKTQYVQAFQGAVSKTIDTYTQGYNAIKNRVYSKYNDDIYPIDVALQRLKDKSGLNCSDIVQLMYQLGKDLGYTVRYVHIRCISGTGHIQLDVKGKEFGDTWKRHDPAKALSDGGDLGTLWCASGTVESYDDSWLMEDDGKT